MSSTEIRFGVITLQSVLWDELLARWQHVEQVALEILPELRRTAN